MGYNPANKTVARSQAPHHSFGTERRFPSPYGKGGPGPNSYRVRVTPRGGGGIGDSPKFGFGTREQNVRPEDAVDRVAYIGKPYERENYGVFSPGPAAYSPRQDLLQKVHAATSPKFTMRPHLKHKIMANGTTLSWSKASGGPGPGSSSPHISRRGGDYLGDAPSHKIGTGVKIPHPASNFSPGPAAYSPTNRYINGPARRREGPSFSFGSAPRPCSTPTVVSQRHYSPRRHFS